MLCKAIPKGEGGQVVIFLSFFEFLERKLFPAPFICTPWMWLTVLGTWDVELRSLVCMYVCF